MSPIYAYQGRGEGGERVSGILEAPDEQSLGDTLRARGLYVTAVREQDRPRAAAPLAGASGLHVRRRNVIVFTVHLATVLSSGIPITTGLAMFAEETRKGNLKTVARLLLECMQEGDTLSDAMARFPRVFSDLYVRLVRAGETVGRVDTVLFDLAASLEWQENLISQIRQASVYPLMLLGALGATVTLIVTIVMPRFVAALTKAGVQLPWSTRVVVGFGEFVAQYWLMVALGLGWSVVAFRWAVGTRRGHDLFDRIKLRTPLLGDLIRKVGLSRFAHHLALLDRSGVNFVLGLTVVEGVVGNVVLAKAVAQARHRVMEGTSLTQALRETGEFPALVLQMVATGESSGSLGETLKKVTEYYDREVPATVRRMTAAFEPVVYIVLGAVVLGTALALYSPLLSMLQQFQIRPRF